MILKEFNLTPEKIKQFDDYYHFLVQENEKYNLTSITSEKEAYIKHFYDSLKVTSAVDFLEFENLLDIGSGAGFPGIPLKILFPKLKLTIIEPTLKRVKFLKMVVELLKLDNVEVINGRAEDEIINRREKFDVVTARAVAPLAVLLELSVPYVKVKGLFLALKGSSYDEELTLAQEAIKKLNIKVIEKYIYDLPDELGKRVVIKFQKEKVTSQIYPRKYSQIKNNHL